MTPKSTAKRVKVKPAKPYAGFPLFPHATGRWAKKIKGKLFYFGHWDDPEGALRQYVEQRDDLYAGRRPRPAGAMTVAGALNRFLTAKKLLVDAGEILPTTFAEYHQVCRVVVEQFGRQRGVEDLDASDFEALRATMARRWGPVRLANSIQRVRSVFLYAYESGVIDRPVRFGPGFKKPSPKTMRKQRQRSGRRVFTPEEIHTLLASARPTFAAMVLLGVNCGYGNTDVAALPVSALDLKGGWVDFARPKTGIARRCPLWPETVEALRQALTDRPKRLEATQKGLVFFTARGKSYSGEHSHRLVAAEMGALLRRTGVYRKGLSFYSLRHTFATVADGARDPVGASAIMGHSPSVNDMSAVYREGVSDARLRAVTDCVRAWLYGNEETK